jgi:uncharacterized protein YuzE
MELTGTIVKIKETENLPTKKEGSKDFQKKEFWLQIPDKQYTQTIALELHGDKITLIDTFTEGQEITVNINLKGKIVGDKCFNALQVWKIQEVKK